MNLNSVDLNKIRILKAVINNGNYQLAGEELGLTRSAISQALTALEYQMDLTLFLRRGRRLYPTDEARKISQLFENYEQGLNHYLLNIRGEAQGIEGEVRVGSYFEFAKYNLINEIDEFCRHHKKATIKMIFDSPSRLQNHLEEGRIDICFSIFPYEGRKRGVVSKKVFENDLVVVVPNSFYHNEFDEEDLLSLPKIEYYRSHQLIPRWFKSHFNKKIALDDAKIFAASAEMLIEFVQKGLGFGVVPRYLITEKVLQNVFIYQPSTKKLKAATWMLQYKNQFQNSAHKYLYEQFLRTSF